MLDKYKHDSRQNSLSCKLSRDYRTARDNIFRTTSDNSNLLSIYIVIIGTLSLQSPLTGPTNYFVKTAFRKCILILRLPFVRKKSNVNIVPRKLQDFIVTCTLLFIESCIQLKVVLIYYISSRIQLTGKYYTPGVNCVSTLSSEQGRYGTVRS